jgi:hypothetical protein
VILCVPSTQGRTAITGDDGQNLADTAPNASLFTQRYSLHRCTADSGPVRRATRVPQEAVSNGNPGHL